MAETPDSRDPIVAQWFADHPEFTPGALVLIAGSWHRVHGRGRGGYVAASWCGLDNPHGALATPYSTYYAVDKVEATGQSVRQHRQGVLDEPELRRQGARQFMRPWCACGWRGHCEATYRLALLVAMAHVIVEERAP